MVSIVTNNRAASKETCNAAPTGQWNVIVNVFTFAIQATVPCTLLRWHGSPPSCQQSTVLPCQIHKHFYPREADPVLERLPLSHLPAFFAGLVLTPVWFTARSLPWVTACDSPPSKLLNLYSKHTAGIALFCPIWYCLRQNTLCHNWLLLMSSFRGAWCQCHHHLSLLTAGNGRRWHLPTAWLFLSPSRAETSQKVSVMH